VTPAGISTLDKAFPPVASQHNVASDDKPPAHIGTEWMYEMDFAMRFWFASPLQIALHNSSGYIAAPAARPPTSATCT
jgi:hypothetical protein